jgi:hypothetical protein
MVPYTQSFIIESMKMTWIDTELPEKAIVIRFLKGHRSKSVLRKAQQLGTGIGHQ